MDAKKKKMNVMTLDQMKDKNIGKIGIRNGINTNLI